MPSNVAPLTTHKDLCRVIDKFTTSDAAVLAEVEHGCDPRVEEPVVLTWKLQLLGTRPRKISDVLACQDVPLRVGQTEARVVAVWLSDDSDPLEQLTFARNAPNVGIPLTERFLVDSSSATLRRSLMASWSVTIFPCTTYVPRSVA